MPGRIRIEGITFKDANPAAPIWKDYYAGCDGYVTYEILLPCACQPPCNIVCADHPGQHHHYERQPFAQGAQRHRPNATPAEIEDDRANVWGWNGDKTAPTLTPSYLGLETNKKGQRVHPYRVHLFLTAGRIALCADSTVTVEEGAGQGLI